MISEHLTHVISQTQMSVLRGRTHVTVMPRVWTWKAATTVCVMRALLEVVPAAQVYSQHANVSR